VNALRRIHAALVPGGLVVDTQPVSARPMVEAGGLRLGTLDMREWRTTIDAVDALVAETIDDGLFAREAASSFIVTDTFDDGPELVEAVSGWRGTQISRALARGVAAATPPIRVHQDVRLQLLRARPARDRGSADQRGS
jgi:hypothetical protein